MLHFLKKKYEIVPNAPFPRINMISKLEIKELLAMESTFDSLFMIAIQKFNDPQNIAHFYTIKTISLWLACCKHKKSDLLSTNDFFDQLASLNDFYLLANALAHQFTIFYPEFLKRSLNEEKGPLFFDAICTFFRAPHKMATSPTSVLMTQWEAISKEPDEPCESYVQCHYEEGGNLLASCFLYLVCSDKKRRDSSFILLATITPVLITYHDRCTPEKLEDIMLASHDDNGMCQFAFREVL